MREATSAPTIREEFWTGFVNYLSANNSSLSTSRAVADRRYYDISLKDVQTTKMRLGVSLFTNGTKQIPAGSLTVEIYMPTNAKTRIFEKLEMNQDRLESDTEINFQEWQNDPNNNDARIRTFYNGRINIEDKSQWNLAYSWLKETSEKIQKVLRGPGYRSLYEQ